MIRRFILVIGVMVSLMVLPGITLARNTTGCFLAGLGEVIFPGIGYMFLGDWDKMLIMGGLRWGAINKVITYSDSPDYQDNADQIYLTSTAEDGTEYTDIFLSRETFYTDVYSSIYNNLTFASVYDLYDKGCEENNETYGLMFSSLQFWHYVAEWTFWLPIAANVASTSPGTNVTYHIDEDLTKNEMRDWSFVQYQLVGVGEEMLFRGVIQRGLFNGFSSFLSKGVARWSSILLGSAIFGAAHSGEGFTANTQTAFLYGVYLGWVYHPAEGDFDLKQAIAIHSWWDTLITYRLLNDAEFVERNNGETAQTYQTTSARVIPLFAVSMKF
ncbi:MAG: CPBP family intramembrane metalloprotease [SAR324 cluster bacterium]|nr:CPBP family intramembrane metalloprotease [SAR324 cluster bacterium]